MFINILHHLIYIEIKHHLHPKKADTSISPEIKQFILDNIDLLPREIYKRLVEQGLDINIRQKQVHFWWSEIGKKRYKRDNDPFSSAQKWLEEKSYHIIFQKDNPKAFGFLTNFWNILKNSQFKVSEIGVDATYNTNNLKFELYVVHAEVDGMGFPLSYLFLENNGNCGNGIRTGVIIDFLLKLKTLGLEPEFFITDKDFAQISAARFVWKNIKIQLCLWHIKKAVEAKLGSNKKPQQINYNGEEAHQLFSFIDPLFRPIIKEKTIFCSKELRSLVWNMMNDHLHRHPLIPTVNGEFHSSIQIWTNAVEEIYNFCKQNSLPWLWVYLWNEWYNAERWYLWLRAGCSDKLSIFKTNMFVEAHWKVLKHDFLYKFFRPRLDLVVFVIMEQLIPLQQRKFEQIFLAGREKAEWRKAFKREWKELSKRTINHNTYSMDINNWVCGCFAFLTSHFFICKHLVQQKEAVDNQFFDNVHRHHQYPFIDTSFSQVCTQLSLPIVTNIEIIEDENTHVYEELYNHLIDVMERSLEILRDQQSKRNFKWVKGVEKNFKPIEKMLSEITLYKRKRTMPPSGSHGKNVHPMYIGHLMYIIKKR
ncbi:unnamed protein product [Rhizophagus irregularis]|nr:unnamed protein product [Rhizophagus irregularis]